MPDNGRQQRHWKIYCLNFCRRCLVLKGGKFPKFYVWIIIESV